MDTMHKIVFIGPEKIHRAFHTGLQEKNWDFQVPVETITDFIDKLNDEDSGEISDETKMIIIYSPLFKSEKKLFTELIIEYAADAVMGILLPPFDSDKKVIIDTAIENAKISYMEDDDFNLNAPYYYIDYEDAVSDMTSAIASFSEDTNIEYNARVEIQQMLPDSNFGGRPDDWEEERTEPEHDELIDIDEIRGKGGTVISVTSSKGGSGKSTVSILLASSLAKSSQNAVKLGLSHEKLRICVVDLDVRDGQLAVLNGAKLSAPNIMNIFDASGGGELSNEMIHEGVFESDKLEIDFVFALRKPRLSFNISAAFYAKLIAKLKEMYDYIILDTSVNYLDPLLEEVAYPISDKIICVSDMGISSVFGMARWITETTLAKEDGGSGIERDKIAIVINKVMTNIGLEVSRIEKAAQGIPIIGMLPSMPALVTYAANTGSLERVLNQEVINKSFQYLIETVHTNPDYVLGKIGMDN